MPFACISQTDSLAVSFEEDWLDEKPTLERYGGLSYGILGPAFNFTFSSKIEFCVGTTEFSCHVISTGVSSAGEGGGGIPISYAAFIGTARSQMEMGAGFYYGLRWKSRWSPAAL